MGKTQHVGICGRGGLAVELTARVALVIFITTLVPVDSRLAIPEAQADGDPTQRSSEPGLTSINPGFDPTMPPQFNMASIAGQGQLFQSCSGGLQSAISQSIQNLGNLTQNMSSQNPSINNMAAMGQMGYGINAVCPGTDVGPSADSISCENLTAPNGMLDENARRAKEAAIEMAVANIQCRKGKFKAVQGELNCLTTQADMLTQQLSSIQSTYQSNIQRMQQDVQKINQVITDRQSQDQDVLTKLNGSGSSTDANGNAIPGNGSKGLIGVRDGLCKALTGAACGNTGDLGAPDMQNSIPGQIQQIQDKMTEVKNKQQWLDEAINQRTMGLAGDCFNNRKQQNFQCVVDGDPVSVHDYVLCMYKQKLGVNANGQIENSANTEGGMLNSQNAAKTAALSDLLNNMMSDMPQKTPSAGPNGQPPDLGQVQGSTILTAADVEAQYGSQLAAFDTPNSPIHDFVMKNISYCFQRAENVVNKEKSMKSSPIGQQQSALDGEKDRLKTMASQVLSGNVSKYEEAMTALTGMNMPLSFAEKCNTNTDAQIACLQDLQRNMEALLHGNAKQTTVQMSINGTDPQTNIVFTCQGLDGCIAALQNVDRNLKTEVKRVQNFKQQYVTAGKQSVDNFTKQMAAMMSGQGAALTNRLKMLNSALATLGVSGGISIPKVDCEQPTFDNDGLPQPPASSLKLIGCKMNPPMMDVSGNDFSSALSNVAQGEHELDDKLSPLNEARNKLAALPNQCRYRLLAKRSDILQRDISQLASGNCQYSTNFCDTGNQEVFVRLANSVQDLEGSNASSEDLSGAGSALIAGIGACSDQATLKQAEVVRQATACNLCDVTNKACLEKGWIDATGKRNCPVASAGVATANASICNGITATLQRDVDRIRNTSRGSSAAGGAL